MHTQNVRVCFTQTHTHTNSSNSGMLAIWVYCFHKWSYGLPSTTMGKATRPLFADTVTLILDQKIHEVKVQQENNLQENALKKKL